MVFDKDGRKRSHRFFRGLMRSAASLSYEQAQAAIDGTPDDTTGPLLDTVLRPLWGAYGASCSPAPSARPLDLDLPERKILLDDEGRVQGHRHPSPARCASPDRGVHDRRQCRRGRAAWKQSARR